MKSLTPVNGQKTDSLNNPKSPIKVAIVDGDENGRSQMTHAVDQSPDIEMVGSYSCGLDAVTKIPSSTSEVVLMDAWPRISGIEITKQLKQVCPELFIFLISGFDAPHTASQARKAGADAYLTKPFSLGQFFESLTTCRRRRKHVTRTTRDYLSSRTRDTPTPAPAANTVLPASAPRPVRANQLGRTSTAQERSHLTGESAVGKALLRMVVRLEENFHTREDLLQEALVHFWLRARQRPGQRLGWYLQSVRFRLHHLRASGRSLDSPKRRAAQAALSAKFGACDQWRDILEFDEGIMSAVNAHDIQSLLLERLEPMDQTILGALAEGIGVRELAAQLKISHQCVIRGRKRIAAIAIELGIVPPLASSIPARVAA